LLITPQFAVINRKYQVKYSVATDALAGHVAFLQSQPVRHVNRDRNVQKVGEQGINC